MLWMAVSAWLAAAVVDTLFKELNLTPELILAKRDEMIARLVECFSGYVSPEAASFSPEAASTSYNPTLTYPLPDSRFMNDVALPIWTENNQFLIQSVYSCLVQVGMEAEAERYRENMTTSIASRVEVESLRIWSLNTIAYAMLNKMGEMGFGVTEGSSAFPSLEDLYPIPPPDYQASSSSRSNPAPCVQDPIQTNLDEAGVTTETEDNTSTPMEETDPAGVVPIGEDAAPQLMIDATAAEENQKDMMEGVENLDISSDTL